MSLTRAPSHLMESTARRDRTHRNLHNSNVALDRIVVEVDARARLRAAEEHLARRAVHRDHRPAGLPNARGAVDLDLRPEA